MEPAVPQFLEGDLNRIRQVMINLIGNALKFTERGGISVVVRPESAMDPDATPGAPVQLQFEVADTGHGIPHDVLEKIFGSFEQVRSNFLACPTRSKIFSSPSPFLHSNKINNSFEVRFSTYR